jgi:molybdate transport system ATP-binding protein
LADHVILLSSGNVKDSGSLDEILPRLDAASLDSETKLSSLFSGMIVSQDKEFSMVSVDIGGAIIKVPGVSRRYSGKKIFIRINADDISIALVPPKKISIQNCIEAMIVGISVDVQSPYALVKARFSDLEITARITRAGVKSLKLTEGKTIYMLIKSVSFDSHL